jgi:hypothetical protein
MGDQPTWECQSSALCAVAFSSASSAPRRPARTAANRLQVEPELRQQPAGERPIGHAAADASARSYQTGSAHRPDRSEPGSARPARQPHNSGTAPAPANLYSGRTDPHSSMPVEFKLPGGSGICTTGCCGTTARGGPDLRGIGEKSLELDFELGGLADRLDLLACQVFQGGQVGRIAVVQFTLPRAQQQVALGRRERPVQTRTGLGYTVSASGSSSEPAQVILAERLSPIQNPDAPARMRNAG